MKEFKKILVAYDFSATAQDVLRAAIDLAGRTGAMLEVLYVEVLHESAFSPSSYPADHIGRVREHLKQRAHETAAERGWKDGLKLHTTVTRGIAAAPSILTYANDHEADLIVVGTHGRRGLRRWLLGSVAEEVVRLAACPVLSVRAIEGRTPWGPKRILVPVDFSPYSEVLIAEADGLSRHFGASIELVHVIEEPLHPAFYNTGVFSIYDVQPNIEERVLHHLQETYEKATGREDEVAKRLLTGHPAHAIVHLAEDEGYDLIIMATHGLSGLAHVVIGSVAEKVVRRAPCPVYTMKAQVEKVANVAAEAQPVLTR